MKSILLSLGALVAVVAAQDLSQLPPCGQVCVGNMLGLASTFNCSGTDIACLCSNVNFTYGVRDCSTESCPPGDAAKVIEYGTSICSQAGVVVTTPPAATTGAAPTSAGAGTGGSSEAGSGGEGATGDASAIATSTIESVVSDASTTFTTSVVTTIFGVGGVPGATSIPLSAITTSPIVSTIVSDGSTILSTVGSTTLFSTLTGEAASSALSSQASAASSAVASVSSALSSALSSATNNPLGTTSSTALAAQQTAAPVGLLAAAGIAALLL